MSATRPPDPKHFNDPLEYALAFNAYRRDTGQQTPQPRAVSVVGAGITGPATALTLAAQGHDVTVYEQRPPDALYSAGVVGITRGVWSQLITAGVPMRSRELGHTFRDYDTGDVARSPFHLIAWTDLHNLMTETAQSRGARFKFGTRVNPGDLTAEYVIDAGGIFSASRRLRSRYSGMAIYRGTSPLNTAEDFVTYRGLPRGYFTISHTAYGAAWALFVSRPEPQHHRTVATAEVPPEAAYLPAEYARIVKATTNMIVSYMSDWDVPARFSDATLHKFTLGDANGPVRPITTSGANLGVIAGLNAGTLITGTPRKIRALERSLLMRRAYDIMLGQVLEGPEIGGTIEDDDFDAHHSTLFLGSER